MPTDRLVTQPTAAPVPAPAPALSEARRLRTNVIWLVAAALAGTAIGVLSKINDEGSLIIRDLGNGFGVWVLFVTLIGAFAPGPLQAVLRATAFMAAAMSAYYVWQAHLFGFFSTNLYVAWLLLSVTAVPVWAAASSYTRRTGWIAAVLASAPAGLLLASVWEERHHLGLDTAGVVYDLVIAVIIVLVVPRGWAQRLRVLTVVVPAAVAMEIVVGALMEHVPGS